MAGLTRRLDHRHQRRQHVGLAIGDPIHSVDFQMNTAVAGIDATNHQITLSKPRGGAGCRSICGTVYSIDPSSGVETVLYSFCRDQNCADGAIP